MKSIQRIDKSAELTQQVLGAVMENPVIRVDRLSFLESNFGENPELEFKRPIDIYPYNVLDQRAKEAIDLHLSAATATSTLAGIPGGWAMVPAGFADIIQYYSNTLCIIQKLGYIYWWPDLRDKNGEFPESTIHALLVYMGVALGLPAANKFIQKMAKAFGTKLAADIIKKPVTKQMWYQVLKAILKAFGKKLTKEIASQIVKKAVPVLGAAVSGSLTYVTFKKQCNRLQKKLKEEQQYSESLNQHYIFNSGIIE